MLRTIIKLLYCSHFFLKKRGGDPFFFFPISPKTRSISVCTVFETNMMLYDENIIIYFFISFRIMYVIQTFRIKKI